MTSEAAIESADLPDPGAVLARNAWDSLEHAYGTAEGTPKMLAELLDDDQRVRSKALDHLHHAVHHQNTLYSATVPAALYVAAIVASPRTAVPVDKKPHDFPGPLRMELLGWLGSVAREADDETEAISRQHGFAPEDYPPILHVRQIRPLLFLAVSACIDDPDLHVREAAIAACIPLLDDSRLCQHRPTLVTLLKEVLGVSALWQYRERAIDTLAAWGEDSTGLEGQREAFAVCDAHDDATPWPAGEPFRPSDTSDLPF
ncbi:hypothetical protein OG321_35195 [Streptomyces sp. NBC_00424]|uniref:hypothetical protein n=1 Tax=Streptomyces sp. NBC_00424 TaxID=2903648 RepID=UPI002250CABA|nr:hypothetical protein [Streptomyces sp. NBC_00424]MCX5077724.1 hypothetical protein [Streptomyces sp. NBC_00424]